MSVHDPERVAVLPPANDFFIERHRVNKREFVSSPSLSLMMYAPLLAHRSCLHPDVICQLLRLADHERLMYPRATIVNSAFKLVPQNCNTSLASKEFPSSGLQPFPNPCSTPLKPTFPTSGRRAADAPREHDAQTIEGNLRCAGHVDLAGFESQL